MRRKAVLLGIVTFAASACTAKAPEADTTSIAVAAKAPDTSADEAAVRTQAQKWFDLYNANNAEGVANLYADDGMILAPNAPVASGRAAILDFLKNDIAATKKAGLSDNAGDVTGVGVSGDLAWISSTFTITDAAGKKIDAGKYTTVYKRSGSDWKIIRDTWNSDMPAPSAKP